MDVTLHAQLLAVGLSVGFIYALVALAFLLIYNGVGALNFAQGDLVMLGAMISVWITATTHLNPFLSLLFVVVLMAGVGYGFGRFLFTPVRDKHFTVFLIATVGISLFFANGAQILWGPFPVSMPSLAGERTVRLLGAVLPADYVLVTVVSCASLVALYSLFMHTFTGRQLRAVAGDRDTSALVGIDVDRLTSAAFVLSAVVSAVAGFLFAPIFFAVVTMGPPLAIKAFVSIVIGGFGNMLGAVVGGLLVGILESYVGYYLSSAYKEAIIFGILILVLLVLPQGLFGEKVEEKV